MDESNIKSLQKIELEALSDIAQVCHDHHIHYFIVAGTLLGAVRHKGFIPWDDDVDIAMNRCDMKRLFSLLNELYPQKYFCQDENTDPEFFLLFSKIRVNGTFAEEEIFENINMHKGIYIDIFPLDKCPANQKMAELYFKVIAFFTVIIQKKIDINTPIGYEKKVVLFFEKIVERVPLRWLKRIRIGIIQFFNLTLSGLRLATIGGAHGYPQEMYKKEWIANLITLKFEDNSFKAPSGYQEILTNMYGDYMEIPEPKDRKSHFTKIKL